MVKNIVLVGFMAVGKTTLGKLLADQLDYNFIDLDLFIEKKESMSISEIFRLKGEAYFRQKESEALDLLSDVEQSVIATGGGTVILEENRSKLKQIGRVIYLEGEPSWILTNIKRSAVIRPLLVNERKPMDKIIEILENRRSYYEGTSEIKIPVSDRTLEEIIKDIVCNI